MPGIFWWFALLAVPLTTEIEVSPATRAVAVRHPGGGPEAERELEALLEGGDRSAAVLLAELFMHHARAGGQDLERGCGYAEAAGDHPEALHNLATCYENGAGRPRDLAKARALYARAADLGFAKAACALGNLLIAGKGGEKNPALGLDLCRRAADAGDADAQTDYGGHLLVGQDIARDPVGARRYLAAAAAQRHRNAAFLLGQVYWNGDGVAQDKAEAARWWKLAYEAGRPDAARLVAAEALDRVLAALDTKKNPPADAVADARRWLAVAAERDPDPAARSAAAEMLAKLASIRE